MQGINSQLCPSETPLLHLLYASNLIFFKSIFFNSYPTVLKIFGSPVGSICDHVASVIR
jgi:hypothetical protein